MTNEKEWIIGVALLIKQRGIFTADRPARHDTVVLGALEYYTQKEVARGIQGFWTNLEHFVDRKEAAKIAFDAGQMPEQVSILMSEDLW